ncbi:hypothetical protein FQR65_LT08238 [Abscondita terminalis]|nr:hypothetical protein FQR65_LT08238 [Abscondita terminalis]
MTSVPPAPCCISPRTTFGDGRVWCGRERFAPCCISPRTPFGDGDVMVWAGLNYNRDVIGDQICKSDINSVNNSNEEEKDEVDEDDEEHENLKDKSSKNNDDIVFNGVERLTNIRDHTTSFDCSPKIFTSFREDDRGKKRKWLDAT